MTSSGIMGFFDSYDGLTLKDPEVNSWPLSSTVAVFTIFVTYLYFTIKIGPEFMEKKKPYTLNSCLIVYNSVQIVYNIFLVYYGTKSLLYKYAADGCCPHQNVAVSSSHEMSTVAWYFYISKVIDLLDTVFFVLRKKQNQVTFLHVYHHAWTLLLAWGYMKYLHGEQGHVIGVLNSCVHAFMYGYYLIAAFGPKYSKYLWWKKYMTTMQMVQFCLMMSYLGYVLAMDCRLPKVTTFMFFFNALIFLLLFGNFYKRTYKTGTKVA